MKPTRGDRLLRKDARWWQFSPEERATITGLLESGKGIAAVAQYCRSIGKPWAQSKISRFFTAARREALAEELEIRKDVERVKLLRQAYTDAGMDIDDVTLFDALQKTREALKLAAADPGTEEGRKIILEFAQIGIAARRLNLTGQLGNKQLELAERRVALLEAKLAEARSIVEETTLSAEEQRRRLREVFAR